MTLSKALNISSAKILVKHEAMKPVETQNEPPLLRSTTLSDLIRGDMQHFL